MQFKVTPTQNSRLNSIDFTNLPFGQICSDHMFVMDYEDGKWKDPEIKEIETFDIHPANLALHYGQSIFEGMKAAKDTEGNPMLFRVDQHAKRINASARRMCMPEIAERLFCEAIHALVDLDRGWIPPGEGSSLYIRPFMFATDEFIGVRPSNNYRFVIFTCPVGPYYDKAVSLIAEDTFVRATPGGVGEAKTSGNYAASLFPAQKANEKGYDQVMWMDPYEFKYIQEVGTMNIFFVMNDKVYTPKLNGAILKGITRDSVIEILKSQGKKVIEKPLSIKKVIKSYNRGELQEVFGSGTAAVISPVNKVAARGVEMILDPDSYKIAPYLKAQIEGIRKGTIKDTFGWTEKVKEINAVAV
ncbi:MAG: branched-chain amino acid aminotransferase [Saprospiraceae bacterium]|jgi:branched-chain amino acid aminotransferase